MTGKVASNGAQFPHPAQGFDPFADRRARDLRNHLSRLFLAALRQHDARELAAWVAEQPLTPLYQQWVADRLARYQQVLAAVKGRQAPVLAIFCQMWNKGLFFECHELAEEEWRRAPAAERPFWQGLTQAAGVYVHLERGAPEAARRLGRKAARNLRSQGPRPPEWFPVGALCAAIESGDQTPPRLHCPGA